MSEKTRLNVNIDKELKEQTALTLNAIGLDITTAINIYFKKIVSTKSVPFALTAKTHYTVEEVAGNNWRDGLDDIEDEWG
jgi:DNA-damage-inducible protein J